MKLFGAEWYFFQRSVFVLQVKEMIRLASTMLLRERSWWEHSLTTRHWGLYPGESFWMKAHTYQALQVQLDQKLPATICSTRCLHLDLLPAVHLRTGTRFFKLHLSEQPWSNCKFKVRIQSYGLALPVPEGWRGYSLDHSSQIFLQRKTSKFFWQRWKCPVLALCFGTLQVPRPLPTSP